VDGQGLAVVVLCLAAATAGCSDDNSVDPITTATGTGTGTGGTGGAGGAVGESLEIQVLTMGARDMTQQAPAVGAVVSFDMPGGERVEQTTGSDGRVSFENIDWSLEPAGAVTGYLEGHILASALGLTPETVLSYIDQGGGEMLELWLQEVAPEQIDVSGTATNMNDQAHRLLVSTTSSGTVHDAPGPDWSVQADPGQPFTVVGVEYAQDTSQVVSPRGRAFEVFGWGYLEHAAVSSATTGVTLDMSQSLTPTSVSGSFAIPQHGAGTFFDAAVGLARSSSLGSDGTAFLGLATLTDVAPDGVSFEYDLEYVEPAGDENPYTFYMMFRGAQTSALIVPGAPTAGAQPGTMPEPITIAVARRPLHDTFTWQLNEVDQADPDLTLNAWIQNQATSQIVWVVAMPPGATEMTLPELPSTAVADDVLGTGPLQTAINQCAAENSGAYEYQCSRWATGSTLTLTR
jgi:hypothetical protein